MLSFLTDCVTVYSTTRQVRIKSMLLAIVNLAIVVTVWCAYLGSLELDLRNIWQKSCTVEGAVVMKVKGIISTEDLSDLEFQGSNPNIYKRVWDTSDLIYPSYGGDGEDGSFIAVTNMIITPNQTRDSCPETKSNLTSCTKDSDCKRGLTIPTSGGMLTGRCAPQTQTCEVNAWCPMEETIPPLRNDQPLFEKIQDFTVMIKNWVEFPDCGPGLRRRNILKNATKEHLASCLYDDDKDTTCPIFRLGDIIKWSGTNFSDVALAGGVFRVGIEWKCDFDWGFTHNFCFPKYYFERIDDKNTKISAGWNFRTAVYHEENRRSLQKMYGLKVLVIMFGDGKHFDFQKLVLAIGATIGLFSVAPLVCDNLFQLLCFLKRFKPCAQLFGDFSIKSKVQDLDIYNSSKGPGSKLEIFASNTTIDEYIGSYKPT